MIVMGGGGGGGGGRERILQEEHFMMEVHKLNFSTMCLYPQLVRALARAVHVG